MMNKNILKALDGDTEAKNSLSSVDVAELTELERKLHSIKKNSQIASDTDYFGTVLPRFRNRIEKTESTKQYILSPTAVIRLAAGAVLPVFLVFYLLQLQSGNSGDIATHGGNAVLRLDQYQTIEEMVIDSPEVINESVDNSFREIISVGAEDLHTVLRESPATEDELEQLLQDSDLEEIIAQLEKKKIL